MTGFFQIEKRKNNGIGFEIPTTYTLPQQVFKTEDVNRIRDRDDKPD